MDRARASVRHRAVTLFPALLASMAGSALVLAGSPFGPSVDLSSLDGTNGFVINGIDPGDVSGRSVSAAGDVNGDGIDDIIIGAYGADPYGQHDGGESYVVFGKATPFAPALNLSTLDGSAGFVINGVMFERSGTSVSGAGDVNGDGIDDLIIGALFTESNGPLWAGSSYVVFGKATPFAASLDLSTLTGADGLVIHGVDADDFSSYSVSSAGDVNGDGIDDLIIGAPGADPNGQSSAGESYVVFGKSTPFAASLDLSTLTGADGFVINGVDSDDRSGRSVAAAGDINGDGIGDLIIGADGADPNGKNYAGESYVVFGKDTPFAATLDLAALDGTNGFAINGVDPGDFSGYSVSSAGDVNGDGLDDLIIGADRADPNGQASAGESYVVFGRSTGFPASLDLSTLNGTNGFVINGIDAQDLSGRSVSSAGDVNGDDIDDLIIGSVNFSPPWGQSSAVESYVVFGESTGFAASLDLSTLTGANGFVINGIDSFDCTGLFDCSRRSVSSAGDVNGDGIGDLIIGANLADPNGQALAGTSYVVFGRAPIPCLGDLNSDGSTNAADFVILASSFGAAVPPNTTGDLNGDGLVNASDFTILAANFGCGS